MKAKHFFAILSASFAAALVLISACVQAAETPADAFMYSRVSVVNAAGQSVQGISIDGFRGAGERDIVIPGQIEGLPVLKIGYRAFNESYVLNSAVLPEGLLEIEPYAFHECEFLRDINIPSTVIRIGMSAFDESGKALEIGTHFRRFQIVKETVFDGVQFNDLSPHGVRRILFLL